MAPTILRMHLLKLGLAQLSKKVSRGAAFGDYDNDGDIDIFLNNSNQPATLLRNEGGNSNHWLTIQPIGTRKQCCRVLARRIVRESRRTYRFSKRFGAVQVTFHKAISESTLDLAENSEIDTLEIHWQSGRTKAVF